MIPSLAGGERKEPDTIPGGKKKPGTIPSLAGGEKRKPGTIPAGPEGEKKPTRPPRPAGCLGGIQGIREQCEMTAGPGTA